MLFWTEKNYLTIYREKLLICKLSARNEAKAIKTGLLQNSNNLNNGSALTKKIDKYNSNLRISITLTRDTIN
ncbi:hypothetical protein BpHYR1_007248 [Brachionus plicatilis]|uniref:Uncharacterized protein n=1 Tax=Brachionus plicatilis TaxID=10195 RepID=A0A3M7T7Y2_BRAPC|nr:hypothetical protein BpHYR1_007248 [Brachionus plicatilis]